MNFSETFSSQTIRYLLLLHASYYPLDIYVDNPYSWTVALCLAFPFAYLFTLKQNIISVEEKYKDSSRESSFLWKKVVIYCLLITHLVLGGAAIALSMSLNLFFLVYTVLLGTILPTLYLRQILKHFSIPQKSKSSQ